MASRKIWKIADFSGGLNNYSNSYDIKSSEFAEFEDITSVKSGIAKPLGGCIKSEYVLPIYTTFDSIDLSSIMPGNGFHKTNVNYTYYPSNVNKNIIAEKTIINWASDGYNLEAIFEIDQLQWIFETTLPTSGTLKLTAQINGTDIMVPLTVLEGNWISGLPTINKFGEKWVQQSGQGMGDLWYHWNYNFANTPLQNYTPHIPYVVHDNIIFDEANNTIAQAPDATWQGFQEMNISRPQGLIIYFDSGGVPDFTDTIPAFAFWDDDYWQAVLGIAGMELNDPRWLLGWTGNDSMARRYAIGPMEVQIPFEVNGDGSSEYWTSSLGAQYQWENGDFQSTAFPCPNKDYFIDRWNMLPYMCQQHHYKLMIGSLTSQIIKGINDYNYTILTVDGQSGDTLVPTLSAAWQTSRTWTNVVGVSNDNGTGLTFDIVTSSTGSGNNATFTLVSGGIGYAVNEEITFTDPGISDNTAVITVATIGGTTAQDRYTAKFMNEEIDSTPHFADAHTDVIHFSIAPRTVWVPDDGLLQNFSISLTSSSLGDTGTIPDFDAGTPAQVAQYTWADSSVNTTAAISASDTTVSIAIADTKRLARNELIRIDNEIMLISRIDKGESPHLEVIRGDTNYYGIPASSRSSYGDQNATHNSGADIYKDTLAVYYPEKWSSEALSLGDVTEKQYHSYMTGVNISQYGPVNDVITYNGVIRVPSIPSIPGTPPHQKIRLYGQNPYNDGIIITFTFADGSNFNGEDTFTVIVPRGTTDSFSDFMDVLKNQIGTIKSSSGDTPIPGCPNLVMGYGGFDSNQSIPGESFLDIYFTAVDTSKTMVINSIGYSVSSPGILNTVTITSGMDNFFPGDYICWQKTTLQAIASTAPGIKEIAKIISKSGSGSSGTIVIERGVTSSDEVGFFSEGWSAGNVFTKCRVGTAYEFAISYEILFGQNIYEDVDFYGDDEIYTLISKSGILSDTLLPSQTFGRKVSMDAFSKKLNIWVATELNNGYNLDDELNWIYGIFSTDISKPLIWDESGGIRLAETNFDLPNNNKIFKYVNISNFFQDLPNATTSYSTHVWPNNVHINGYMIEDNEVKWNFSVTDKDADEPSDDSTIRGLSVSNDATTLANSISTTYFSDEFARMYVSIVSTSGGTAGLDWAGLCKFYATAVYEDGSETLPIHKFDTDIDFGELGTESLQVSIYFRPTDVAGNFAFPNKNIVGIRLYYTNESDSFIAFNRIGTIDFRYGFLKSDTIRSSDDIAGTTSNYVWKDYTIAGTLYIWNVSGSNAVIQFDSMPVEVTYEYDHGFHPSDANSLNAKYKTITLAGNRSYIGNISINDGYNDRIYNDLMIVSPAGKLDVHPYPANELTFDISDGDEIIALASVGDRILQFKKKILYVLDISTGIAGQFAVENKFRYKGISHKNHFCYADDSVFWFNGNSAYIYDGEALKDLFIKGGEIDGENNGRIDPDIWNSFISEDSMCGYNPKSKEIIIIRSTKHYSDKSAGDCYIYSIISDSWSFGKEKFWSGEGTALTIEDVTPTPNTAWTSNQIGNTYVHSVGTSGGGRNIIVTITTNGAGNPEFTLVDSGIGYKIGDTVLFYDPEFDIYGGGQTIPSAELIILTEAIPKFITNFINFGDDSNLGFISKGNMGDNPGSSGDGSGMM